MNAREHLDARGLLVSARLFCNLGGEGNDALRFGHLKPNLFLFCARVSDTCRLIRMRIGDRCFLFAGEIWES